MKRLWNDTDKGKAKYSDKSLSQCHFVHDKYQMDRSGIQLGPASWQKREVLLIHFILCQRSRDARKSVTCLTRVHESNKSPDVTKHLMTILWNRNSSLLPLQRAVFTCSITTFIILPKVQVYLCVFKDIRAKSDYFPLQHTLICFYNGGGLLGTN
jgi:hypothetical protein